MMKLHNKILLAGFLSAALTVSAGIPSSVDQFPDGARVAFFGDSITHGGVGFLRVAAHYRKTFPERNVRFYNCGISGGTLASAKLYFDKVLMSCRPTHVVFAFGVNDSRAFRINAKAKDKAMELKRVDAQAKAFRERYAAMIDAILAKNAKVILRLPTPFNADPSNAEHIVRNEAHRRAGKEIRSFAAERGIPVLDDYGRMSASIAAGEASYENDRLHPNDFGQWRMAEALLSAQGLSIAPYRPRAEVAQDAGLSEWDGLMQRLADINSFEWLVIRNESLDVSAKIEKAKTWMKRKGPGLKASSFMGKLVRSYIADKPGEELIRAKAESAWKAAMERK